MEAVRTFVDGARWHSLTHKDVLINSTMKMKRKFDDQEDNGELPDMTINQIKTSKDDIKQPALAANKNMYIAPLGSSIIICGKSGSGKSTLMTNFIKDKRFYNGFFKKVFLFSPTAGGDDVQRELGIPKKHVYTSLKKAPQLLEVILRSQQEKLDGGDKAGKVDQFAIIFDDVIGDTKFMNDRQFTRCFYQVRHVNCTTFICAQHFKRIPRVCRLQANFVHYFACSQTEVDTLTEEFCPPRMSKLDFQAMVNDATEKPFSFLTINMKVPWRERFRFNLDQIVQVNSSVPDDNQEPEDGSQNEQAGRSPRGSHGAGEGTDREFGRQRKIGGSTRSQNEQQVRETNATHQPPARNKARLALSASQTHPG